LKLLQREEALDRGIELIEWTFDPLEIKNAYLNIEKLGAIARRYNINQYGITSSPLPYGGKKSAVRSRAGDHCAGADL
jgi:predicted GNAT superfamily acetyltransferase